MGLGVDDLDVDELSTVIENLLERTDGSKEVGRIMLEFTLPT